MKNTIRLTEADLKRIISESVKNIITESASDVIRNIKPQSEKKKVRGVVLRVLQPERIESAFSEIEKVLDEITYMDNPRVSVHYLGNLRKKVQSLKNEFNICTSNLGGSVANQIANPWSQDRRTYKYKPSEELTTDEEPVSWYERNEHGDFDEI